MDVRIRKSTVSRVAGRIVIEDSCVSAGTDLANVIDKQEHARNMLIPYEITFVMLFTYNKIL